jgi:hypothetical protein
VTEPAIHAVIRDLAATGARVTGVAVREELSKRYGVRGGVARVYRVLQAFRRERVAGVRPNLREEVAPSGFDAQATLRAERAETRERVHQERWARETDALRTRLAGLESAARDLEIAQQRVTDLAQALASAHARISRLEALLAEAAR